MHDIVHLEGLGIPGVFVTTTGFDDAAAAQGRSLGFDPPRVLVPHPIQDRTDDELIEIANHVIDEVVKALMAAPDSVAGQPMTR